MTMLACEHVREALLLPAPENEAERSVRAHLETCPACVQFQRAQARLDRQLRAAVVLDPPTWVMAAVRDEIAASRAPQTAERPAGPSHLAQWAIYLGVFLSLASGLFLQDLGATAWLTDLTALPSQLVAAYEVLRTTWTLLPLDSWAEALSNATAIYAALTLALLAWWLRDGERQRTSANEAR